MLILDFSGMLIIWCMISCLLVEYFSRAYLFELSIKHIKIIREGYTHKHLDLFFKYYTELADKYAVAFFFFVSYHILDVPEQW